MQESAEIGNGANDAVTIETAKTKFQIFKQKKQVLTETLNSASTVTNRIKKRPGDITNNLDKLTQLSKELIDVYLTTNRGKKRKALQQKFENEYKREH